MKINNEYVKQNEYVENCFNENINNEGEKNSIFVNDIFPVEISNGEGCDMNDIYNKFGVHDDYERLQQWGLAPADEEEVAVSVYERIQIQLMTYCEDYNGTGINIDKNKMAKVLGSKSMAEAVSKTADLPEFTDNTKEYMLKNNLEPTVDNVYKAIHSCGKKEVNSIENSEIKRAVEEKLIKDGFELNKRNIDNAMWLVSRNIELNPQNMSRLSELNQIDDLKVMDEQAVETVSRNIAYSLYAGGSSKNAYITDRFYNMDDVGEVIDTVNNASDEAIAYVAANNYTFNAANLKNAMSADKSELTDEQKSSIQTIKFKQVIFEARIVMTQSSVFNLKRLGVDINYTDISQMTENIVNERNKLLDMLLKEEGENITVGQRQIFAETFNVMSSFNSIPNAVAGKVYSQEISFTMTELQISGTALKNQYEEAANSYETLGTQVRHDLGGSYAKAFSNVDNILEEVGMEVNSSNQRAVRILGYNSMEITKESVNGVKEIATELDYLISNMTPKTALHLIKNGINPLEDNIRDVNAYLEKINEEIGKDDESMGRFLWKLEKKGQVTQEEKSDYIELYRILGMISKNDGNVIGRVISEGKECTLKNLYSAYKSKKHGDFDYSLDDESVSYVKKSVRAFMEKSEDFSAVLENGEPKDISVEDMLDTVKINEEAELSELMKNPDSQMITNIAAYIEINSAKDFRKKLNLYKNSKENVDKLEKLLEGDKDVAELEKQYEELEKSGEALLNEVKLDRDLSYEKLQGALLMKNALKMMSMQAKKHSYFVPVNIGEEITNVHLTINHTESSMNNVTVALNSEKYGSITSIFTVRDSVVTGRVVSDKEGTVNMISENMYMFSQTMETAGISTGEISCFRSSNEASYRYNEQGDKSVGVNTYYSVAKAFIKTIKFGAEVK